MAKITIKINNGRTVIRTSKIYTLKCNRQPDGSHKTVIVKNYKKTVVPTVEKIVLTIPEANMLDVLTRRSKLDTWFYIDDSNLHHMVIRDLENYNKVLDTCEAILLVADAITDIHDYRLTYEEIRIWKSLLHRVKLVCRK